MMNDTGFSEYGAALSGVLLALGALVGTAKERWKHQREQSQAQESAGEASFVRLAAHAATLQEQIETLIEKLASSEANASRVREKLLAEKFEAERTVAVLEQRVKYLESRLLELARLEPEVLRLTREVERLTTLESKESL